MPKRLFTGEDTNNLREELTKHLGEVVGWFTIDRTPQGGAPEEIKREWIGVAVPIREHFKSRLVGHQVEYDQITGHYNEFDGRATVCGLEAALALDEADKTEVAKWWLDSGWITMSFNDTLAFRMHEGAYEPVADVE